MCHHSSIPDYALFGENRDLPDILHCEAIKDRAGSLDWHISPHRHGRLFQFFLLVDGGGEMNLDGRRLKLGAGDAIAVAPRIVHGFSFDAHTRGWVVTIPTEVLENCGLLSDNLFSLMQDAHRIKANAALQETFALLARDHAKAAPFRRGTLIGRLALMASLFWTEVQRQDPNQQTGSRPAALVQFEHLIDHHGAQHWGVADYAAKLGMTPTHLNRLCRAHFGLSASKIIEGHLVLRARRALAYTRASISEIAYDLGFVDPAYFSRVFRRATGFSPSGFRQAVDD